MATVFRPPIITRIEPASRWEAVRAIAARTSLALLTAAAPALPVGVTDDFQNPIIKIGYENRTFLHRDVSTLGSTPALPPPTYDYPNPRAYQREVGLLSYSLNEFPPLINLIGSPLLPFDWTNPLQPRRMIDLWTHIDQSNDILALSVTSLPKNTETFLPPRGYSKVLDLHNYTYYPVNLIGASPTQPTVLSFDYPNPRGATYLHSAIRVDQVTNFQQFVASPASLNYDFPNPRRAQPPVDHLSWLQSPDVPTDITQPPCTWVTFQPIASPWRAIQSQSDNPQVATAISAGAPLMPPAVWVGHYAPLLRSIDSLTYTGQAFTALSTTVVKPTIPVDQPNPRGPTYPINLRWHGANMLESVLSPVVPMRSSFDLANPIPPRRVIDFLTIDQGSLPYFQPVVTPTIPVDQPNPLGYQRMIDLVSHSASLLNSTLQPMVPNIFQYDFPNPRGYAFPNELRTWLFTPEKAFDQFFGQPGQVPANLDWPNPRGYQQPIENRFFTYNGILDTTLFTSAYQPQTYDFPNPKGYQYSTGLLTWTDDVFQFAPVPAIPNSLNHWPNPQSTVYPVDIRVWTQSPQTSNLLPVPALQPVTDNPIGPKFSVELLSFSYNGQLSTLGGGSSHLINYDFPNPIIVRFPNELRTWVVSPDFNPNVTFFGDGQVFANLDWPNPKSYAFPVELRSFVGTHNNASSAFFGAAGQPPANLDWPVPKSVVYSLFMRVHFLGLMTTTLNPGPPPPSSLYPDHISTSTIRIAL